MKKIIQLEGETFTKLPYDDLIASYDPIVSLGWRKVDCGVCSDGVNHVFALMYGDMTKPTIFIQGGIHGWDEWPNDYWVRDFAKEIAAPTNPAHAIAFAKLRAAFSFIILPCINPYGYINRLRYNANHVDLNRNFDFYWDEFIYGPDWDPEITGYKGGIVSDDPVLRLGAPFDQPESQITRNLFQQYNPIMFHDCHGWGAHSGIGISQLGSVDNTYYDFMGGDLQKTLNLSVQGVQSPDYPNIAPKYIFARGADLEARPTAGCWGSIQQGINGFPVISSTTEISVSYYPEAYTYQQRYGKTILFAFCIYCYNLLRQRNMILV